MEPITIIIEDISEGGMRGFAATMHGINDSIAMGDTFEELFKSILMNIETAQELGMGVFADQNKIPDKNITVKILGLNKIKA